MARRTSSANHRSKDRHLETVNCSFLRSVCISRRTSQHWTSKEATPKTRDVTLEDPRTSLSITSRSSCLSHLPGTAAATRRRPHEEKREDRDSKRRRRRKGSALDDLRGRYDQLCSPVDKRLLRHCTNTSELLGDE